VLKSARLLTLTGFRPPKLIGVIIETGRGFIADALGWPPHTRHIDYAPFANYYVWRGRKVQIAYGVVAPKIGEYGDSGIQITALVGGTQVTVNALGAAGTCVESSLRTDCPESFYNHIQQASSVPNGGVGKVIGIAVH